MTLFSSAKVELEFTAGIWTDVSSYYAEPITIHSGRATEFDTIGPGSATVTLYNNDGRFTPENSSSPYFPKVTENIRLRISVTKSAVTYIRFVGYVSAIEMGWIGNGETLADAIVYISAVDSLAIYARRVLPLPLADLAIAGANAVSTWVDISSMATPSNTITTNVSSGVSTYVSQLMQRDWVTYGVDPKVGFDGYSTIVKYASPYVAPLLQWNWRSTLKVVEFWVDGNSAVAGSSGNGLVQFYDGSGAFTGYLNLANSTTQYWLQDGAGTHNYFFTIANTTNGWVKFTAKANGAAIDWYMNDVFATTFSFMGNINALQKMRLMDTNQLGGGIKWGTVMAAGDVSVTVPYNQIVASATGWTVGTRLTSVRNELSDFSPGYITVGSDNSRACVAGTWNNTDALTFLRSVAATNGSIIWARWDGQILFMFPDVLYPLTPLLTIDSDADLIAPPTIKRSSDVRPTRVTVNSPALSVGQVTSITAVDTVTEAAYAGASRHDISVNTLVANTTDAYDVGFSYMSCSTAMRITQLVLDLDSAGTDYTATLFNQATSQGALYPTQRISVTLPSALYGASSKDVFIQGWTEEYTHESARLTLDCSPATIATVTGGSCVGNTSTGTVIITSDRPFTTVVEAYPLDLDWAGERITVSAPGGATSPQTFTVTARGVTGGAAASAHGSGTHIDAWHVAAS